ncbi:MAG: hypothetical protein A4E32_01181 [Methanomassiliicoccales archaeon PtaU1.Bin124]|nr:MAG: hypothetical protein A4E32_01181 [Methanomassiliicoccales archaeon PtaU1.Bin124]
MSMAREGAGWPERAFVFLAPVISLALILNFSPPVPSSEMTDQELASYYCPVLMFSPDERLRPMDALEYMENCSLWNMRTGVPTLVEENITFDGLVNSTSYSYLDCKAGGLDDNGIIDSYAWNGSMPLSYVAITHSGTGTIIQYWFFYAFNYGQMNRHEGDWEMYQVMLDKYQVPQWAMVSQHHSGQKAMWSSLEKVDGSVTVHVELGSHAMFFTARAENEQACVFKMVDFDHTVLTYEGRWGEWAGNLGDLLGRRGPPGPMFREDGAMWQGFGWGLSLPQTEG